MLRTRWYSNWLMNLSPRASGSAIAKRQHRRTLGRDHRRIAVQPLEERALLALTTFMNDNWNMITDNGAPGVVDAGDVVRNNNDAIAPGTITAIYGTDGFGTVTTGAATGSNLAFNNIDEAIAGTDVGGTLNVLAGGYAENVNLAKMISLLGIQAGVDARGRVVGSPNLAVESVIAPPSGIGLTLATGVAGATINGLAFQGGVRSIESASGPLTGILISNNHFGGFTDAALFLDDPGDDITIFRNVLDGTSKTTSGGMLHLDTDTFDGLEITQNWIINAGTGIGLFVDGDHNVGISAARTPLIQENRFADNDTGANLGSRSFEFGEISDNVFNSNDFDGLQGGIQNTLIARNTFSNNGRTGLALTGFGSVADPTRGAQSSVISENLFFGNTQEDLLFAADQFPGTISTNSAMFNSFGSATAVSYGGAETIDVTCNWWGSITGPTNAANPGGTGSILNGTGDFQPWLVYGTDADPSAPGFQLQTSISVPAQTSGFTTTNNNYRRLANVIDCLVDGQTVTLSGVFDWNEPNAAAAWALGNDGIGGNLDDFTLFVRPNLNNITITAASLGAATIQGPGDLAAVNLEGVFFFDDGDNQNWTFSNLQILDFDLSIGMFQGAGGADAYSGTTVNNNHFRVATDRNQTAAPGEVSANIGVHYSFGINQTFSNNLFDFAGDGVSAAAPSRRRWACNPTVPAAR